MGGTSWSADTYKNISSSYSSKTQDQVFTKKTIDSEMNPHGLVVRECRDSAAHPNALAIQVWLDVTGSMGEIPEVLVKKKLGALMETIINHKVADPAILFGAIGDHYSDRDPLQVGQYESGTVELDKWLTSIHLEGGGGAQNMESYLLAWLVAGRYASIDCFEKRNEKGFVFTIGDEYTHPVVEADFLRKTLGGEFASELTAEQLLAEAQKANHVFHIHISQTPTGGSLVRDGLGAWKKLMGERLIVLDNYEVVAETIATTIAMIHGMDMNHVTKDFDAGTAGSVSRALQHVTRDIQKTESGVMAL